MFLRIISFSLLCGFYIDSANAQPSPLSPGLVPYPTAMLASPQAQPSPSVAIPIQNLPQSSPPAANVFQNNSKPPIPQTTTPLATLTVEERDYCKDLKEKYSLLCWAKLDSDILGCSQAADECVNSGMLPNHTIWWYKCQQARWECSNAAKAHLKTCEAGANEVVTACYAGKMKPHTPDSPVEKARHACDLQLAVRLNSCSDAAHEAANYCWFAQLECQATCILPVLNPLCRPQCEQINRDNCSPSVYKMLSGCETGARFANQECLRKADALGE